MHMNAKKIPISEIIMSNPELLGNYEVQVKITNNLSKNNSKIYQPKAQNNMKRNTPKL